MSDSSVSFVINRAQNKAPVCHMIVRSPAAAKVERRADNSHEDDLADIAWEEDPATCRQARAELAEVVNRNPCYGWGTTRYTNEV